MDDPGYRDYDDPRLQPPEEPEVKTCLQCAFYREVYTGQRANGFVHCAGVCIFEVYEASTLGELAEADLVEVDPTDEPCRDYREDKQ